jgi:nucleoside triphosphatase
MGTYENTIEVIVGILVVNADGKLLFVTGPKWKGEYTIVGGHVEFGERIEEALERELREEIGVVPKRLEFLHLNEAVFPSWFYRKAHFVFLNFVGFVDDGSDMVFDPREFTDCLWLAPDEALGKLRLVDSVKPVIAAYKRKYT